MRIIWIAFIWLGTVCLTSSVHAEKIVKNSKVITVLPRANLRPQQCNARISNRAARVLDGIPENACRQAYEANKCEEFKQQLGEEGYLVRNCDDPSTDAITPVTLLVSCGQGAINFAVNTYNQIVTLPQAMGELFDRSMALLEQCERDPAVRDQFIAPIRMLLSDVEVEAYRQMTCMEMRMQINNQYVMALERVHYRSDNLILWQQAHPGESPPAGIALSDGENQFLAYVQNNNSDMLGAIVESLRKKLVCFSNQAIAQTACEVALGIASNFIPTAPLTRGAGAAARLVAEAVEAARLEALALRGPAAAAAGATAANAAHTAGGAADAAASANTAVHEIASVSDDVVGQAANGTLDLANGTEHIVVNLDQRLMTHSIEGHSLTDQHGIDEFVAEIRTSASRGPTSVMNSQDLNSIVRGISDHSIAVETKFLRRMDFSESYELSFTHNGQPMRFEVRVCANDTCRVDGQSVPHGSALSMYPVCGAGVTNLPPGICYRPRDSNSTQAGYDRKCGPFFPAGSRNPIPIPAPCK